MDKQKIIDIVQKKEISTINLNLHFYFRAFGLKKKIKKFLLRLLKVLYVENIKSINEFLINLFFIFLFFSTVIC